jgi:hypothetical protein
MRPAGLDDRPELLGLCGERPLESDQRRDELFLDRQRSAQLQRRRDVVVRALTAVDIVIRMDAPAVAETPVAMWATTSFMFVFVDVPEPVW